jgi:hypothetical protein
MNSHSKGWWAAVLATAAVAVGCGGGSGGGATDKAGWTKAHGAAVSAVSTDLDAARQALDTGQRPSILSSCNQLQEDLVDARKGLPVPDATVDGALRAALDAVGAGVPDCLEGARLANQASVTEKAIAEFRDARPKLDDADKALAAWQ